MMPPECQICGKSIRNAPDEDFKLLYFKRSPEQEETRKRMQESRMVGHPPGAHWFCETHAAQAEELTHLEFKDARFRMRGGGLWNRLTSMLRRLKN